MSTIQLSKVFLLVTKPSPSLGSRTMSTGVNLSAGFIINSLKVRIVFTIIRFDDPEQAVVVVDHVVAGVGLVDHTVKVVLIPHQGDMLRGARW